MRSLHDLPVEVIRMIIHYIGGGGYLRGRVDRLLVCKSWYEVAQVAALEDLIFTVDSLQRFLVAPSPAHHRIRTSTRYLFIEGITIDTPDEIETGEDERTSEAFTSREQRTVHTCESLISFAIHLSRMDVLNSFWLKLPLESPVSESVENVWNKSILTLISSLPSSLTSLTIDNPGEPSKSSPDLYESYHICPQLLARDILPSLHHLRIRARSICPKIFELNNIEQRPQLETLTINLSMKEMEIYGAHACYCAEFLPHKNNLYLHMSDAAKAAIAHLPSIRQLRIIRQEFPLLQVVSYDVISNKRVVLSEDVRWDDIDWIHATNLEFNEHSDVDLFDDSTDTASELPWVDLEAEVALQ